MKVRFSYDSGSKNAECLGTRKISGRYPYPYRKVISPTRPLLAILLLLIVTLSTPAQAAMGQRDAKREAAIVAELRKHSPEAVADFEAATIALDKKQFAAAAAGYRRVLEQMPDFDPALRRLGVSLVQQGKTKEGIVFAERAVQIRETPENLCSLAVCLAFPPDRSKPTLDALHKAFSLINKAVMLAPEDSDYLVLKAEIAFQLDDHDAFESTVKSLQQQAPDLMATHYYAAIVAATNEKWLTAEWEIRKAERLGLPSNVVQGFLDSGVGTQARLWFWGIVLVGALVAWAVGLVLMFILGKMLSMITLASIERDDPNRAISSSARLLRTIYRRLVSIAGLYWYISLPFVAVIVIALTVAVFYAFLVIGRIPIKLAIILLVAAAATLYAIVRSLFVRVRDDEDPGRAITEFEAPELWKTVRKVADTVGTRPVDEIWLTPGTDLAVFERGTVRQKMTDRGRRALILGAGVLEDFGQGAFRAVLAHEYGHFSHRDTAGGDVALRVQHCMIAFFIALAKSGFAVSWNIAFQFLRLYDFLFRRISHGATRLQEVLADRVAIQHYGLDEFRNGLTHVIRRSILFHKLANNEIEKALQYNRVVSNLYSLPAPADPTSLKRLECEVTQAIQVQTTEDDTHPSPKDRFRLGERIHSTTDCQIDGYVWQLFIDPAALMAEMTSLVAKDIGAKTAPQTLH